MTEQKSVFVILEKEERVYDSSTLREDELKIRVVGTAATEAIAVAMAEQFNNVLAVEEPQTFRTDSSYRHYYSYLEQPLMTELLEPVYNKNRTGDIVDFEVTHIRQEHAGGESWDEITLCAPDLQPVEKTTRLGRYKLGDKIAMRVSDFSEWIISNSQLTEIRYAEYSDLTELKSYYKPTENSAWLSELSSLC